MKKETLAIIPGTTFIPYQYALANRLEARGIRVKIISAFRFHLTAAKHRGIKRINRNLGSLIREPLDTSISDEDIDIETLAFRKMFKLHPSYHFLYRKLVAWYSRLFHENQIGSILVFNGSKIYQQAAIRAARAGNIAVIYLENGYFSGTMQIDPCGVNFNNSLAVRFKQARDSISSDSYEDLREFVTRMSRSATSGSDTNTAVARGIGWWCSLARDLLMDPLLHPWLWRPDLIGYLRARRGSKPVTPIGSSCPANYFLLVLQVECDTQHVLHCPLFQTMSEAIRICIEARDEVLPGLQIVVRPHPVDPRPPGALERVIMSDGVTWDEITSLEEAIAGADVVCTTNSSVGLQALLAGKRVFVLGDACYALPLVCPSAVLLGSAVEALRVAINEDVSNAERMKFLTYAIREYFVYGTWSKLTDIGLDNSADRIVRELTPARLVLSGDATH